MQNNTQIATIDQTSPNFDHVVDGLDPTTSTDNGGWDSFQQQVTWLGIRLVKLATDRWPSRSYRETPDVLVEVSEAFDGEHPERMRGLCQGFLLLAHGYFEAAIQELDEILQEHNTEEVEPFWNLALEAHATCLMHTGREFEALTEFAYLLDDVIDHEQGTKLDRQAKFYGLARSIAAARARIGSA